MSLRSPILRAMLGALVLFASAAACAQPAAPAADTSESAPTHHRLRDNQGLIVIGHRGCAGEVPENTLASFQRGLERGAAILESDVHLTRDGVPVLIHDDEVSRVSEGTGRVAALDLGELQKLDASMRSIREGEFLEALVREETRQDKDWVIRLRSLPDAPEPFYLMTLILAAIAVVTIIILGRRPQDAQT